MVKVTSVQTISGRVQSKWMKVKKVHVNSQSKIGKCTKTVPEESCLARRFKEFASNTALHGYNHIVREDSTKWERIAWILIVVIATVVAAVLLYISWQLNLETPTITVIESTHYPISNVPFPAVTICSMNSISARTAMSLALNMKRPSDVSADRLSKLFQLVLHFQGVGEARKEDYNLLHNILQTNQMSVVNLTSVLKPKCTDLLKNCRWKGTESRCEEIFQSINTIEGICCSFNYYGLTTNNFAPKVAQKRPKEPRRTSSCGYQTGLTVILTPMSDDYHSSFFSSYGVRVLVHDPYDFPDDNAETKAISRKMIAFVMVYPETTYSTSAVRSLSPDARYCYFHDEHRLSHMQRYSYVNCLAECRTEIAYRLCGCVPYFLPNNGSYRVCEMNEMECARENRPIYFGALPGLNKTIVGTAEPSIQHTPCNCLPDCQLNQYPTEITSAHLNRSYSFSRMGLFKGINITDHTSLTVFFGDLVSTHYRKDIYQNWLSLLASFGGILGLLLGFSFVAGFELIYFFTIRVLFDRWASRKNKVTHWAIK
ncbi:sodium channel protein Nach-like [Contarinia nasturtii]|uniref:sodium channel protein Nach-like n=1 Tax=Contarinia nasturtii TaxID=265458 RepID=UPI0012D42BD7|nr:sodium channel protein Nach-like [Contarinia nasturtii]